MYVWHTIDTICMHFMWNLYTILNMCSWKIWFFDALLCSPNRASKLAQFFRLSKCAAQFLKLSQMSCSVGLSVNWTGSIMAHNWKIEPAHLLNQGFMSSAFLFYCYCNFTFMFATIGRSRQCRQCRKCRKIEIQLSVSRYIDLAIRVPYYSPIAAMTCCFFDWLKAHIIGLSIMNGPIIITTCDYMIG